ncbi:hypothetical protein [Streptomyces sp. CA-106131]|jgi:hypothetical protein|uniref:hypothetical protein n=1 Tax=Streptomyces sp. CA-106131 TaxID=3240045 RepID=UPI003D8AE6D3
MMAEFVLAFPYKGALPGETVDVSDDDLVALTEAGIGKPAQSNIRLVLGRLPEMIEMPAPEKPVRRLKKSVEKREATGDPEE